MKITIGQLNPTVGDFIGNLEKAKNALRLASQESSDLLVLPELFVVGYPPRDFLEKSWFIKSIDETVQDLVDFSKLYPETGVLVGAPTRTMQHLGKKLHNTALLINNGQITARHKSLLPTYDVFDEDRYFAPASGVDSIPFKNEILGVSICEDAWNDPDLWPDGSIYSFDPIAALAEKGATLFINISASPFQVGKEETRYQLISNHARKHRIPFIYVNQVGGNDELVFDGRSMFVDREGMPVYICPAFKECIATVDSNESGDAKKYVPQDQVETIYQGLVTGIRDYVNKCGFSKVVVGLSGGIDSAVTCALAAEALGKENVLGIAMPSPFSSAGSVEDAHQFAVNQGIDFHVIPIKGLYDAYIATLGTCFEGREPDITEENIQARIRGNILMAFSNKFGYLVMSTGNKSELSVGYCTLYGDMSGGLSVLADVPKTLVYDLAEYINRSGTIIPENTIKKAPSAELKLDQKDEDSLPPYNVLDQILDLYIEKNRSTSEIISLGHNPEIVRWVVGAVDSNEYKRKQAAPGLRVTSKAFGGGRRMPIAARHSERV